MASFDDISTRLLEALHGRVAFLRKHRTPFTIAASVIFLVGLVWSFQKLNLSLSELDIWPALGLFFVMAPLGILYGAIGLIILVHIAGGTKINLAESVKITAYAQLAESLPLPGGAIVRTAALMKSGVKTTKSVGLVVATAILWISVAALGAGGVLITQGSILGYALFGVGLLAVLPVITWIFKLSDVSITALIIFHRMVGVVMMAIRILLAFAILKLTVSFETALFFTFANIAGSATSLAPAGLGVGEVFAAAMADLVKVLPATAFLAIALNRIIGLMSCASLVGFISLFESRFKKLSSMRNAS